MSTSSMAEKLKAEADAFFRAKKFTDAIEKYTAAIDTSAVVEAMTAATAAAATAAAAAAIEDAVAAAATTEDAETKKKTNTTNSDTVRCYSNRAACREKLVHNSYGSEKTTLIQQGLADGRACVQLDPEFVRGYQRLTTFLLLSLDNDIFRDDWKKPGDYTMDNDNESDSDDDDDDGFNNNTNTNKSSTNNNKKEETETAHVRVTKIRRELETVSRRGLRLDPANEALLEALQVLRDLKDDHDDNTSTFALNGQLSPTDVDLSLSEGASARSKSHKTAGATAFQQKNWTIAEKFYTKALACDPVSVAVVITAAEANAIPMGEGHATAVLYSNRSATRAAQEQYETALRDATRCVTLRPEWSKGHSRRATALFGLGRYTEAEAACVAGLVLETSSKPLQTLLETCQQETCESLEVQQEMFRLRTQAKQDRKMEDLMKQFSGNGGPGGPKVFNTNNMDFSGGGNPFANMGSGMGSNGLEGLFGGQSKKPKLSDQQMRGLARATVANGGRRDMNNNSHSNNNSNSNNNDSDTIPVMPPPSATTTSTPSVSATASGKNNEEEEVLTDDDDDDDDENGIAVKSIIE